jgi:hypothetical protein
MDMHRVAMRPLDIACTLKHSQISPEGGLASSTPSISFIFGPSTATRGQSFPPSAALPRAVQRGVRPSFIFHTPTPCLRYTLYHAPRPLSSGAQLERPFPFLSHYFSPDQMGMTYEPADDRPENEKPGAAIPPLFLCEANEHLQSTLPL